jgi:hypothetical protein
MGLINNDMYEASNGTMKSGTYISFNNETIYVAKNTYLKDSKMYVVNANYRIYWDKTARDSNKPFIELRAVNINVSEYELSQSVYHILYNELYIVDNTRTDKNTVTFIFTTL